MSQAWRHCSACQRCQSNEEPGEVVPYACASGSERIVMESLVGRLLEDNTRLDSLLKELQVRMHVSISLSGCVC